MLQVHYGFDDDNGAVITDAMKYIIQKTEQVNTLQKLDDKIEGHRRRRRDYNYKRCLLDEVNSLKTLRLDGWKYNNIKHAL